MNAYLSLTKGLDSKSLHDKTNKSTVYEEIRCSFSTALNEQIEWYRTRYDEYQESLDITLPSHRISYAEMETISPVLVGHGGVSVLETSLMLHRIYGVPYIPGTALKGLTAHYCHQVLGQQQSEFKQGEPYYVALFGSTKHGGIIEFHDAWITPTSVGQSLVQDVMTPHHQAYNSIRLTENMKADELPAPRDDDDPVPIPFLGVKGVFRTILTCPATHVPEDHATQWLGIAREILNHAVAQEGVGGKTNAGYGRMTLRESVTDEE